MSSATVLRSLNRLLALHCQSVPMYLSYTTPWITKADEKVRAVLRHLVADQKTHSEQIARLILDLGGSPNRGQGEDLTPLNDLALGFLLQRIIKCQGQDIGTIEECLNDLTEHAEASALAQEALGMAKGHLESLEELAQAATNAA